ncbi:5-hydroxytryptamine receptor 1A-beta-like [Periophthalmus magnuspinnatus]|uniref:5-hydroxytryptamine receptor 1A-beta-like n=1 Tax=Periophthalmus magnuspinnatus TaxID=409849 RepID=UPI00145BF793|nr:5-hydroxytryptamine receptor 1A-beta-like [Periophthalmus magnuspinnatus]
MGLVFGLLYFSACTAADIVVLKSTWWPEPEGMDLSYQVVTSVLLGALILCAIIGNAFVVAAIALERSLQTVANFLIGSLAVTDLMVSVLVLPMAALYQVLDRWTLGPFVCHVFVSLDVLCCTSSILHLSAIALDRYWAIVTPLHHLRRTRRRAVALIGTTWLVSFSVSVPPMLVMRSQPRSLAHDRANPRQCRIWQELWYTVYSTFGAFYIPLALMLVLYGRIFKAARFRIRRSTHKVEKNKVSDSRPAPSPELMPSHCIRSCSRVEPLNSTVPPADEESLEIVEVVSSKLHPLPFHSPRPLFQSHSQSSEAERKLALARERKAVKTLGVIIGTFILCWLPFFIVALVMPFCQHCSMPRWLHDVINWLGYSNSLLNPLIYAFCNKDFRRAFSKIMHCRYCAP